MSEDYGKHFTGVEDLIQKHMLVEADIQGQADRVKQAIAAADEFLSMPIEENGNLLQLILLFLRFHGVGIDSW